MRNRTIIVLLLIILACTHPQVSRSNWQRMSSDEKMLYVSSLVGAERVKDAKGGGGKKYEDAAEEYVKRIDDAYARGDERDPDVIFAGLGAR